MGIIIYPSIKKGGGDISFMVNTANTLVEDPSIFCPIYLVSEFKDRILSNYQLKKGLTVLTPDEFMQKVKENTIIPTLIIEGPCYVFGRRITPPASAPILYLTEYSSNEEIYGTDTTSLLFQAKHNGFVAQALESGVKKGNQLSSKVRLAQNKDTEYGLQFSNELVTKYKEIEVDLPSFQTKQWQSVDRNLTNLLLKDAPPNEYHNTTKLYFQYCHQVESVDVFLTGLFDLMQAEKYQGNCDLLSLGENDRLATLQKHTATLFKSGFTKIIYVDDAGKETIVANDPTASHARTFRMLHKTVIKHQDFLALLSLAEKFAGLGGDQSFTEGIALGKTGMYECYKHKSSFYQAYIRIAISLNLMNLAAMLYRHISYVEDKPMIIKELQESPIDYPKAFNEFKSFREYLLKNFDYNKHVRAKVIELLNYFDPKKNCAKSMVMNMINQRIDELSPYIKAETSNYKIELEFLIQMRSYILKGFSIKQAFLTSKQETENKFNIDPATSFIGRLFSNSLNIAPFIQRCITEQEKENTKVDITTNLSSNFILLNLKS